MRTEEDLAVGAAVIEQHRHHSHTPFYFVWGALLVLTGIEVMLAYQHLRPVRMLSILMALSVVKSALIIGFFMHLKYEVTRMRRLLMVSLVVCLSLMCIFFPDAFRILQLGVK
jgi:cytochrome c oxidase subunit 4